MSNSAVGKGLEDGPPKHREIPQSRIRRRNRMITSCLECRRRKLKCDKLQPECSSCVKFSRECMFLAPALDSVSQKKLNELKEKMGSLEKVLEDDIARRTNVRTESGGHRRTSVDLPGEDSESDLDATVPEDEKRLEATPLASFDIAYDDDNNADILDTGITIGMFRINERIGGMFRPRFSEEIAHQLGAPIRKDLNDPDVPKLPDHDDFISPGPTFIAPGAGFIFGDVGPSRNLLNSLPTKATADTLTRIYYRNCHSVARTVHWPSFQSQYDLFWAEVLQGIEPQASLQALVLSVFFTAVVSMEDEDVLQLLGNKRAVAVIGFQTATEVALAKAQFLKTTRLETLQALVIYCIPLCRDAVSRAHSVLVGTVVRLAECMGLHRDPAEHFGASPIDTHVRRILWFQICWLDYHTADKQGPRPAIRREDYDTRFPLNTNDADFITGKFADHDSAWTDMTLTRLRFECCEMLRIARVDIERLHQQKITITHALGKIESFRRAMEAKYFPVFDTTVPLQRYAKHVLIISIFRLHITMLHRYHNSTEVRIPDRLRQVILTVGTQQMESAMSLCTDTGFGDWKWYTPALIAWPTTMLLALEMLRYPQRREADRIWTVLDFVYKTDTTLPREMKVRQILSAVRDRTAFYRDMRGFRVPVSMKNRLSTTLPLRGSKPVDAELFLIKPEPKDEESSTARRPSHTALATGESERQQPARNAPVEPKPTSDSTQETASASETWTFADPFPVYVNNPQNLAAARSRIGKSTVSSPGWPSEMYDQTATRNAVKSFNDYLPGLDNGQSPSNSSTNTESWPPPISSEHGWRYAIHSPRSQMHQNSGTPSENYSQGSSPQAIPNNVVANPPSFSYMTQGTAPMPMQYTGEAQILPNAFPNIADIVDVGMQGLAQEQTQTDAMMMDIDWAEWDKIFPPDTNTGNLDQPNYAPM